MRGLHLDRVIHSTSPQPDREALPQFRSSQLPFTKCIKRRVSRDPMLRTWSLRDAVGGELDFATWTFN